METPCINICVLDASSRLCAGCGRSLTEIGSWSQLSQTARRKIMAQLPARMRDLTLPAKAQERAER
jgi:uncharacterized protein